MKLGLHACCGPCLLEPLDALSGDADEVIVVFANPNIHPFEEYERRRDTLLAYAESAGVTVVEAPYDPARWVAEVGSAAGDATERCRRCYALRMGMAAEVAAASGCDALATTLTVSPYQDAESIESESTSAARAVGIRYVGSDFRDRYPSATRRSRELGMYRQNYCGCILSDIEARQARAARREQRARERGRD